MTNKRLIYGIKEIADAINIPRKTLAQWHFRQKNGVKTPVEQLPTPTDTTSTSPVWLAEVIEPWIENELARQQKWEEEERLRQRQGKTDDNDSQDE